MGEVWLWDYILFNILILVTLLELSIRPPYDLWGIKTLGDDFMIDKHMEGGTRCTQEEEYAVEKEKSGESGDGMIQQFLGPCTKV